MPWQMAMPESFLGQLAGGALGAYNISQQAQQQKLAAQQARMEQENIASEISARTAAQNLDQQRFGMEQQQFATTQKKDRVSMMQSGFDPDTGQAYNYGVTPQQMQAGQNDPDPMKRAAFNPKLAALAAAKGLYRKILADEAEIAAQRKEIAALQEELAGQRTVMARLATALATLAPRW